MLLKRRMTGIALAAALMMVALVGAAAAQSTDSPSEAADTDATTAEISVAEPAGDAEFADFEGDFEDWEPTAEEALPPEAIAEINAETDALVEYLKGKGFDVKVATDELGFTYVDVDEDSDEALFDAMDEFYEQLWADYLADMSDEEKAEWNGWTDEFIAELAEQGITAEKEEIAPGVFDIVWTEELEEALGELDGDLLPVG